MSTMTTVHPPATASSTTPLPFLADDEVRELTHRERPAAQARALDAVGIPYRRRLDGTLLVIRDDIKGTPTTTRPAANGLDWSHAA
ncbi:DUF4224 domain-containing protein [Acidovorax sp. Leaf160]|uniref:DUF4224 domain-containing protein n=1 Tax=Acidovorax sp. Leaf160 TaxID=1736280 RepID=UPI0007010583|nr:DUF4224 domain-containing protein [Acidovorax sp. Leaf160]KQR62621.1 hypothetical protein ASF94_15480 [Acidovorax sp. Leaf160]